MKAYRSRFYMGRLTLALAALAVCGVLIVLAVRKLSQPMTSLDHVDNGKVRHSARQVEKNL